MRVLRGLHACARRLGLTAQPHLLAGRTNAMPPTRAPSPALLPPRHPTTTTASPPSLPHVPLPLLRPCCGAQMGDLSAAQLQFEAALSYSATSADVALIKTAIEKLGVSEEEEEEEL